MKIIMLVLDGLGDWGDETPLSIANTPNIDFLMKNGRCGLLDVKYPKEVNSDYGYLNLLGYFSKDKYPGRGYLEALGIGLNPGPNDVCMRGNFATLDSDGNIQDRRAGRDETGLDELAEKIDGMEIDGITFNVKRSRGHRIVVLMKGKKASVNITQNDPTDKTDMRVKQSVAKTPDAKTAASAFNKFIARSHKILSQDSINKKRKFPANVILARGIGKKTEVPSFKKKYGLSGCCIAGIPIAKGVARFVGLDMIDVPGATGDTKTNLNNKMKVTIKTLKKYDFVFLHINGTDILSHDKKFKEKAKFIEKIDKEFKKVLEVYNSRENVYIVTCDHRSISNPKFKGYAHVQDPVPVLVSGDGIKPKGFDKFTEKNCEKPGNMRMERNELLPTVLRMIEKIK